MRDEIDIAEIIQKKLAQDETLLWCGHPYDKTRISVSDVYRMNVGILWCAANLFMLFKFYLKTEGISMVICLAVFVLFFSAGFRLIISTITRKKSLLQSVVYAITSRRILFAEIDNIGNVKKMESIPLDRAEEGNLISKKDGTGTITFWSSTENQRYRKGNWAFNNIKDCERVWDVFRRARDTKRFENSNKSTDTQL